MSTESVRSSPFFELLFLKPSADQSSVCWRLCRTYWTSWKDRSGSHLPGQQRRGSHVRPLPPPFYPLHQLTVVFLLEQGTTSSPRSKSRTGRRSTPSSRAIRPRRRGSWERTSTSASGPRARTTTERDVCASALSWRGVLGLSFMEEKRYFFDIDASRNGVPLLVLSPFLSRCLSFLLFSTWRWETRNRKEEGISNERSLPDDGQVVGITSTTQRPSRASLHHSRSSQSSGNRSSANSQPPLRPV
jgi:hypothetical protein